MAWIVLGVSLVIVALLFAFVARSASTGRKVFRKITDLKKGDRVLFGEGDRSGALRVRVRLAPNAMFDHSSAMELLGASTHEDAPASEPPPPGRYAVAGLMRLPLTGEWLIVFTSGLVVSSREPDRSVWVEAR